MSHLVLARKYRPSSFDQVVGQDVIVATIKAAVQKNRIAHAMLFTGSRGVGKTTIARIVAKALVCVARVNAEPCGTCAQCVAIDNFSSLDVVEIDGASHTGVDDIRDLRDSARYQPTSAKYKIFIIDEVHMLSISAFNALLKILEEPPPHVLFIFATTESHKIPKTILSRCQRYDFKRVSVPVIQKALKVITVKEGLNFADDGLLLIAELADGGMRDALSLTEQVITTERELYSAQSIADILGVVSHQAVKQVAAHLIEAQVGQALAIVKEVYESGLDLCQLSDAITARFRILSLCAHVDDFKQASNIIPGLEQDDFAAAKNYDKADLKRLFAMALDGMAQVFQAKKPLLALELLVLRMALRPSMSEASTINFCLNKLDDILHNRPVPLEMPGAPAVPTRPLEKPLAALLNATKIVEPKAELKPALPPKPSDILGLFSQLVEELSQVVPGLASHLRHAEPKVALKTLQLTFSMSLHYEYVLELKANAHLVRLIKETFGEPLILDVVLKKEPRAEAQPAAVRTVADREEQQIKQAEQELYDEAANHPVVKKALEIFGGDITSVARLPTHEVV